MNTLHALIGVGLLAWAAAAGAGPAHRAVAVEWNETVLAVAEREDGFLTLKGLRTAAMLHLAMHDALNNIEHRYATYTLDRPAENADPLAAATAAAFAVAKHEYPGETETFARINDRWLGKAAGGDGREAGVRLGEEAAAAVLRSRRDDGWDADAEYNWHPMAPGVYAEFHEHSGTPQGFVFGAGWANATGFGLDAPGQFRSPPPPAIDSDDYTRAYDEVREVGRFQSMARTPDQTHLALWWKDFVENSHNRLARELVAVHTLSLAETVRLFALLNMSIFDAYVSSFDNKFFYNHWRPYTAIRWADNDGNPDTEQESTWTNTHRHTYAFPSYPSAHGTACAAAMTVMADVFGPDLDFTMYNPVADLAGPFSGKIDMHPPSRDFDSFDAAAMECALSRVYLGIHFRYDSTEGFALGRKVGENVVQRLLTEQ